MCKPGNQTIYRECKDKLKKSGAETNTAMREALKKHDGCMQLDKHKALC